MRHGLLILCCLLLAGAAWAGPVVCIDPGHPSERNAGRAVQHGLREVDVNWAVAQALAARLKAQGVTVVLTKTRVGEYVTNRRRAEIANAAKAALFIRLHCDTGAGRGYALYYPDRQGQVAGHYGPPAALRAASKRAAEAIRAGMAKAPCALRDNGVKGESATFVGRRQGALTGSIFSKVPAVTVEMAFLSNRADAANIGSRVGRDAMAQSLASGIARYLEARK
jgi:N-acetylmuramoyl-L-alanine amidase